MDASEVRELELKDLFSMCAHVQQFLAFGQKPRDKGQN